MASGRAHSHEVPAATWQHVPIAFRSSGFEVVNWILLSSCFVFRHLGEADEVREFRARLRPPQPPRGGFG